MSEGSRSSSAAESPARVRWVTPSVADAIFVGVLAALVFTSLSTRLLGDAGIGWHIRTGQQIRATHAVPRVDPFSSSMAGKPWFAWEWLYDLIVGELEARAGLNGVVWLTGVVIATVFAGMISLLLRRGVNLPVALPLVLLALVASMIHFLTRPHVVSWLFTLTWFWILESSERECLGGRGGRSRRWLWILPALMLLWVNVHGGFLMGFVLLVIFWLAATWSWLALKDDRIEKALTKIAAGKRSRDLAWVGLLSLVASLVNPYGWRLHQHIFSYLSNRFLMDHIEEFQSPNFHGLAPRCFLVLVLISLVTLAAWGSQLRPSGGLTVLFVVYAGVYSSRNIPVSSVLLVMIVAPLISPALPVPGFLQRMQQVDSRLRGHLWPAIALILTLGIAAGNGRSASGALVNAHFNPQRMPVDAVNYLQKSGMKGPVLSPDYWGGYLIYRLYPKQQVVVDDRHDLYGEAFFKSYLKMMHGERGWQEFLRDHPASCLLLPRDSALASILIEKTQWKSIYADDVATAFVPIPGPAENPAENKEPQ